MKTLKIMSIIGIVWFGLCLICAVSFNDPYNYQAAIGWGIYAALYGIALAIVALTKVNKFRKENK